MLQYPLTISFKLLALHPQAFVKDASGNNVMYVKQKLFKLKESLTIFSDETQSNALVQIDADRILDFSANYTFRDLQGNIIGSIRRSGARSIWKAHYVLADDNHPTYQLTEENAWVKLLDGLVGEIPVLGAFSGYFLNPRYLILDESGKRVATISKKRTFLESQFTIEKHFETDIETEMRLVLGTLMMIFLERSRG
jgi:uncharacterized protein YxjI